MKTVKVALLGFGTIGSSVGRIIAEDGANRKSSLDRDPNSVSSIADTIAKLEIVSIVSLDTEEVKSRLPKGLENVVVTDDALSAITGEVAPKPDIVVELMGGVEPAHKFILAALNNNCSVVTANKAVLGEYGKELRDTAKNNGVHLLYEASVGGAVPIVRVIRHSLMGDKIISIQGVLNGTTNFILDKMTHEGMDYDKALKKAQELGFAEADPTADVEGGDAAAKISILASLA
ncbi:MAG: homoserine dehydrogenase, partial [Candidatus Ancillula sp.]|nr:homoserine dehydrogenase [Candidatus Ancillula sp.]